MKVSRIAFVVFALIFSLNAPLSAATLTDGTLTIEDGSTFCLGAPAPFGACVPIVNGSDGGVLLGQYQPWVLNSDVCGLPQYAMDTKAKLLKVFQFFGAPTFVSTNAVSWQSCGDHDAPTVDVGPAGPDGCSAITADLSSWEVFWNGNVFEQGPRGGTPPAPIPLLAAGTLCAENSYTLDWPALIVGGPFNGVTGYWSLVGHYEPPPLVASVLVEPRALNVKSQGNGFTARIELEDTDGSLVPAANIADGVMVSSVGGVDIASGAITENLSGRAIEDLADPATQAKTPNGIDELKVTFDDPATGSRQDIIAAVSDTTDGALVDVCVKGSAMDALGSMRSFEACSAITIRNKGNR